MPAPDSPAPRPPQPETVALRALQRALGDAQQAVGRRMRMPPSDLAAMDHISSGGQRLGPTELAARLGLSPAAATELVDRLEHAGHVVRERDDVDRRRVRLVASAAARDEVLGRLAGLLGALDAVATEFSDDERDVLRRYLDHAADAARRFAEEDPASS